MADTKLSALTAATSVDYLYGEASGVSKKIAPANVGGIVPISAGKVTSPVSFIDLVLPSGYVQFKLNVSGIQYTSQDTMGIGVSYDAGATFINDTVHSDSYFEQGVTSSQSGLFNLVNTNPLMDINQGTQGVGQKPAYNTVYDIFPGSATDLFSLMYLSFARNGTNFLAEFGAQGLNPNATVAPTLGRVNLIRLLPFGNGDIPPTSGETITAGFWTLFGIPTPA